ncbi:peptidoglycan -binding protein [Kiloniella sp. b19]|uniref:peptidoglycan -binding protein n=1 Tax=Kiloniella sp. GXU_MW_B19 TaxID=3141326 RepID=UPI0031E138A5
MQSYGRGYSNQRSVNIWPGFVDALATLLLVVIFVLMVFMVAQFTLSATLNQKNKALGQLNREVAQLAEILALEQSENSQLRASIKGLNETLAQAEQQRASLADQLAQLASEKDQLEEELVAVTAARNAAEATVEAQAQTREELENQISALEAQAVLLSAEKAKVDAELVDAYSTIEADKEKIEVQLAEIALLRELRQDLANQLAEREDDNSRLKEQQLQQQELTEEARAEVVLLNQQIAALRRQLASISNALDASEALNEEQKAQILNLGKRLNVALATKVQQLARYQSEFFGRLREVLGNRSDIRIVGDRFVFQSEVLFNSGEAVLGAGGREQMAALARTLLELTREIPEDIDWVLRVDGHTDIQPIATATFPSNWELSTARAISVVKFLMTQGIPANRLAATGFGEFQPLDTAETPGAFRKNRRIELKLTQR